MLLQDPAKTTSNFLPETKVPGPISAMDHLTCYFFQNAFVLFDDFKEKSLNFRLQYGSKYLTESKFL